MALVESVNVFDDVFLSVLRSG
ncbi:BnaC02g16690D [Brassica napus]|uniref:BnaC02g16690D protein n=1 Tax=Brassica napus TaxID=3708 RepID=A0A078I0F5_BRANA|nr:BnaC02g16690D [Brassica napus]